MRYLRERSYTNTDLNLDDITTHPGRHRIVLSTPDGPYDFFIKDLLLHWRSQLLGQQWRTPTPVAPTNPFTNEPVTSLQFIRVYCIAELAGFVMHDVLTMLYRAQGNMQMFYMLGAPMLRKWATYTYDLDGDVEALYE